MDNKQLPIIDWELGIKLAGGKKELATEILDVFISTLAQEMIDFQQLEKEKNYTELLRRVHKFHGGVAYLGLPRIKTLAANLESDLKSNIMSNLPSQLTQLNIEVNLLLEHFSLLPS